MEIQTIGIDLGKTLFHLVDVDADGSVVVHKRCSRSQLLTLQGICKSSVSGRKPAVAPTFWDGPCAIKVTTFG
jgi:hypothetical protein